jgi:uncharacterized protein involved in exopolysaccharide biosynthesis
MAALASFLVLPEVYKAEATIRASGQSTLVIKTYLESGRFKRKLAQKYDLLPVLYEDLWDTEKGQWKVKDKDKLPTVDKAIADKRFSISVNQDRRTKLITVSWEGKDPQFCQIMVKRIIAGLKDYLNNEYISDAQLQIEAIEQELKALEKQVELWAQKGNLDRAGVPDLDLLKLYVYAGFKERFSELKVADALARKFEVVDEPVFPHKPYKPKRKLIVAVSFVTSLFLAVFLVFFFQFVQKAREKNIASQEH